jgi:4-hydroxy-3-methylbut-2-enyl diphosphate reductase
MRVEIDKNSGYCFGVEFAIQMAEDELKQDNDTLYCLGDIVHNDKEVERLHAKGLKVIDRDDLKEIRDSKVLIRAHGEPPETYKIALNNNLELIDASCPVVLKLQNRVKHAYDKANEIGGQVIIYGQKGHAEVIGLTGQTEGDSLVVTTFDDLDQIDFSRPVVLFSQTTKSTAGFYAIRDEIAKRLQEAREGAELSVLDFNANDSICRQVSNREPQLTKFSQEFDVILFVSGKKSSNGKALYAVCKSFNPQSYFIESENDIDTQWFEGAESVGICGATSTPMWLMQQVASYVQKVESSEVEPIG